MCSAAISSHCKAPRCVPRTSACVGPTDKEAQASQLWREAGGERFPSAGAAAGGRVPFPGWGHRHLRSSAGEYRQGGQAASSPA